MSVRDIVQAAAGGAKDISWDISYAQFVPINVGDISNTLFVVRRSVSTQDSIPSGVFFKPDGTKMYMLGRQGDYVNEYSLSSPWTGTPTYIARYKVYLESDPMDLFFKPDGTKMYVVGFTNDFVAEYNLSTAWDITTTSYVQNFSVAAQDLTPRGLFFKPDGTKMYVVGDSGNDINEYSLSTAWDVSTATYVQVFSVSSQTTSPRDVWISEDGLLMYVISGTNIYQYSLSSAWDISTATYTKTISITAQGSDANSIFISSDLNYMAICDTTDVEINIYQIVQGFSVAAQEASPTSLFFKPDGTKMYVLGTQGDDVNEYNLSSAWDISTASYVQNFSVSTQDTGPQGLFFKPDGTKMYIAGNSSDSILEYSLSSAWNVSTASYVQAFSVAAQDVAPNGVFFKSDGTKMYFIGGSGDSIYEYSLSSAWNVSTASYVSTYSVSGRDSNPSDLFFKPDGTKMYSSGQLSDNIFEFNLSSAWDITTASYIQSFSVNTKDSSLSGFFFKPDGLSFWIIGQTTDSVYQYNLEVE